MNARKGTEQTSVDVFLSHDLLMLAATNHVVNCAERSVRETGRFVLALSGGSTPRGLYQLLSSPQHAARVNWKAVHLCWGDERCVPLSDAQSNYRLVRENLLDKVSIPEANLHRIRGEGSPEVSAIRYEAELRRLFATATGAPRQEKGRRFDLVLLGLGADGHTASLFPQGVGARESSDWVIVAKRESGTNPRISIAPALLNAAAEVVFLVTGANKAEILRRVLEDSPDHNRLPAQVVAPTSGHLRWMVDVDAASRLRQVPNTLYG